MSSWGVAFLMWSGAAHAQDPAVGSDGFVSVRRFLAADPDAVRAALDTGAEMSALHGDAQLIEQTSEGRCERLTYRTRGLISSMFYIALRCPTPQGWSQTLVSSDDFTENEAYIELTEVEGGTEIWYRIRVKLDLPVGQSLVDSQIARSMRQAMESLEERLVP